MFGSKIIAEVRSLEAKVSAGWEILASLKQDIADGKATWEAIRKDIADGKAVLARVEALTGHTASTATAVLANQVPGVAVVQVAAVSPATPSSAPVTPGPAGLVSELAKDVAGVNPMQGVKLP